MKGRDNLGVNLGRFIVTNGDGNALFPNYFGEDLMRTESAFNYGLWHANQLPQQ